NAGYGQKPGRFGRWGLSGMIRRQQAVRLMLLLSSAVWLVGLGRQTGRANAAGATAASPTIVGLLPVLVLAGQSNMISLGANTADLSGAYQAAQTSVLFYGPYENGSTWN